MVERGPIQGNPSPDEISAIRAQQARALELAEELADSNAQEAARQAQIAENLEGNIPK